MSWSGEGFWGWNQVTRSAHAYLTGPAGWAICAGTSRIDPNSPPLTKISPAVRYAAGGSGGSAVRSLDGSVRRAVLPLLQRRHSLQLCLISGALMASRHFDSYLIATHDEHPFVEMRPRRRSGRGDAAADQSAAVPRGRAPGGSCRRRGPVPGRPPPVEGGRPGRRLRQVQREPAAGPRARHPGQSGRLRGEAGPTGQRLGALAFDRRPLARGRSPARDRPGPGPGAGADGSAPDDPGGG